MKIWLLSDTHLGCRSNSPRWLELIRNYFYEFYLPLVKKNANKNEDILYHLGDVFDNRQNLNLAVLDLGIELFEELTKCFKEVHIIVGNHDIMRKNSNDITSVDCLKYIPKVFIHKTPQIIKYEENGKVVKCSLMPWQSDRQEELDWISNKADYLFCHTEINGYQMTRSKYQLSENGNNASDFHNFTKVYSGHIHYRQMHDNTNILYVGNPYQMTRNDIGNDKGVYCLDPFTNEETFYKNEYSPVFLSYKISDVLETKLGEFKELVDKNFVDITVPSNYLGKYNMDKFLGEFEECAGSLKLIIEDEDVIEQLGSDTGFDDDFDIIKMAKKYISMTNYDDDLKEKLLNSINDLYNTILSDENNN